MASNIDPTKPVSGQPTTLSVRDNFAAAKGEIEALQDGAATLTTDLATATTNIATNTSDISTLDGRVDAIEATPPGTTTKYYSTKAAMDADLVPADSTGGIVTNDPDPSNNSPTIWRKSGATGTGSWVKSQDRLAPINAQITDLSNDALPINFNDSTAFEVINTSISNPSTRYNWSIISNNIVVNQTFTGVLLIGFLTNYTGITNRAFTCKYSVTAADTTTGFGICFNPSDGSTIDPTNHVSIIWRANSGLVVAYRQDGVATVSALTAPGAATGVVIDNSVPRVLWTSGDTLEMTVVMDADGTTGAFTLFKNGLLAASFRVPGLPSGYIGATGRNGISCTFTFSASQISKIQQAPKRVYINPNVGMSSIGTEANPFQNISDGLLYVNESGRRLDMVLKGGVYAVPANIQTSRYDSISIVGDQGRRPIIRPGSTVTSGWTQTPGSTKVWQRTRVYAGTTGSTTAEGAYIDMSQPDGSWGFCLYTRLLPLSGSVAQLEALASGVGGYWTPTSGIDYIKPKNDIDPNTLSFFRCEWQTGINLLPAPASLAGHTDIHIAGIDIEMPYAHGILAGRTRGLIEDCFIKGAATLNAISPNLSSLTIASCRGVRCFNDGINHTDPTDFQSPNPPPDRIARTRVLDCEMTDMVQGDGLSNHVDQDVFVSGGQFLRNGKCGLVPVANAVIVGAKIQGNLIGVQALGDTPGFAQLVSVRNCDISDNQYAFNVTASGAGSSTVLEVLGGQVTGSTVALFQMRNDQATGPADLTNPSVARVRNMARSGNTAYRVDVGGALGQVGYISDVAIPITPGAA